jgi:hypothetical protein
MNQWMNEWNVILMGEGDFAKGREWLRGDASHFSEIKEQMYLEMEVWIHFWSSMASLF